MRGVKVSAKVKSSTCLQIFNKDLTFEAAAKLRHVTKLTCMRWYRVWKAGRQEGVEQKTTYHKEALIYLRQAREALATKKLTKAEGCILLALDALGGGIC